MASSRPFVRETRHACQRRRIAMNNQRMRLLRVRLWPRRFQVRRGPFSAPFLVLLTLVGLFFVKQTTPQEAPPFLSMEQPSAVFSPLLFERPSERVLAVPPGVVSHLSTADPTPTCSIWDANYIDCLIGQASN